MTCRLRKRVSALRLMGRGSQVARARGRGLSLILRRWVFVCGGLGRRGIFLGRNLPDLGRRDALLLGKWSLEERLLRVSWWLDRVIPFTKVRTKLLEARERRDHTMVNAQVIRISLSCTSLPSPGAFATCNETSILLLPVANVTFPLSSRSQISLNGCCRVIRSTAAVTVMTASPVCL